MNKILSQTNRKLNILVPDVVDTSVINVRSKAELLTHNTEKEDYFVELENITKELELIPVVHRLLLSNMTAIIDSLPFNELILNLCDGSDVDGVPGPSVEEKKFPCVIGCDSQFINNTLTKNGMKEIFKKHLVSTPPGFPVTKETDIISEIESKGMTYPLFVKVSDSYGSVGLDDTSVCHNEEQLLSKCENLFKEFDNLTCEEFIDGQEFSVLILGNCRDPEATVIVYPPAERAFNKNLGRYQKFISFDRNWDESLLAHSYEKVEDANDSMALQDLARRAYIAVSGNCYGRVDVRKRDVSGKFYVLEVNASCGLGKGTSSEFILHLAGQSNEDFFKILLSTSLSSSLLSEELDKITDLPSSDLISIPTVVKAEVSKLISHPSLARVPTPVVHVIVSAVLVDADYGVVDPEMPLSNNYGKDAEYVSELENIFRNIGLDPIVHLFHVEDLQEILSGLDKEEDVVFNACLGSDGFIVAEICDNLQLKRTVGLNAQFFKQSTSRPVTKQLLSTNHISIPRGVTLAFPYNQALSIEKNVSTVIKGIAEKLKTESISFPVYVKPGKAVRHQDGQNSGRSISTLKQLEQFVREVFSSHKTHETLTEEEFWILEELLVGDEFRVLVAGDGRDPNRDVIVFPPIKYTPDVIDVGYTSTQLEKESTLGSSSRSLLMRKESINKIDKTVANQISKQYHRMSEHELILQMDIQDLARRAYCAVHGSCYGLVHVVNRADGNGLTIIGVHGDVRFGENAKASIVMQLAGLNMSDLFQWLISRA